MKELFEKFRSVAYLVGRSIQADIVNKLDVVDTVEAWFVKSGDIECIPTNCSTHNKNILKHC